MKKLTLLIVALFVIAIPALIYTQTMSDYCSAPPYVTRTVPPNITIVMDNSKSMLDQAYPGEYNPATSNNYIGYFKTNKRYCTSSSEFYEEPLTGCGSDKGPYPGSLLNWATMSKYDIVMLVLIGGQGTPSPSSRDRLIGENMDWAEKTTSAYPECIFDVTNQGGLKITSSGTCTLNLITSSGGAKIIVAVSDYIANISPRGIIQKLVDKYPADGNWDTNAPRISVMNFQASQNDIQMTNCIGTSPPMSTFVNQFAVSSAKPDKNNPNAPLGKTMTRTIEYYKNICGTTCNPCGNPIDSVSCRKNFVLTISSGEATDIPSPYTTDYLNEQLRQAHTTSPQPGALPINYYNVHIFGAAAGKDILKGFSKYGGFFDSNSNNQPDLPGEWDKNGDGIPDTYYEAAESSQIQSVLERAFQDILAQAASGTAVSVLTTSTRGVGSVVQAYFLPIRQEGTREVWWTGYMQNIWIDPDDNLREDTIHDYQLILNQDKVMKLYFNPTNNETESALFTTLADGTGGTFSACSSPEIKKYSDVTSLWEAGKKLALRNPLERTIFTAKKAIRGTTVTHTFTETPYPLFTTVMNAILLGALNPDATYTADNIVRYVRGECLETGVTGDTSCGSTLNSSYRDRRLTVDGELRVWKLGDIISSTPKVFASTPVNTYHVDYADISYYEYISSDSYKKKSSLAFVGANDGKLHAFRVGYLKDTGLAANIKAIFRNFFSGDTGTDKLGQEVWAYIPFNAFPYLKYLTNPDYCHLYYNDLSVRLIEASINGGPTSTRDKNSWKTLLIGGMRLGGACGSGGTPADPPTGTPINVGFSSYFAIDITDPENPVPLWEFSDDDMGYATTFPSIVRTGDRLQNGNWYVMLGSGSKVLPKGGVDIDRSTTGYIYILNLGTGELVKKIGLGHNAIVGDILAIDADKDYYSEKIYFGTSYKDAGIWKGKFMSISIPNQALSGWSPASSDIKVLFTGNYPFTASPDAAKDTRGNIWAFEGSGKYYSDLDETDASTQIFFGLKDRGTTVAEGDLFNATNVLTTGTVTGTTQVCAYDPNANSFGLKQVVTSINPTSSPPSAAANGWKVYFTGRERVISRPLAVGGLVDFLTYKPDVDPCKYGGDSYLYSVGYTTGVAPSGVAIRSPEATSGLSGIVTVYKGIRLGPGAPPTGEAIIIPPPKEGVEQLKKKIQIATGVIVEAENQPVFSVVSKIVHWLKK